LGLFIESNLEPKPFNTMLFGSGFPRNTISDDNGESVCRGAVIDVSTLKDAIRNRGYDINVECDLGIISCSETDALRFYTDDRSLECFVYRSGFILVLAH